jgi:hypothetical protein
MRPYVQLGGGEPPRVIALAGCRTATPGDRAIAAARSIDAGGVDEPSGGQGVKELVESIDRELSLVVNAEDHVEPAKCEMPLWSWATRSSARTMAPASSTAPLRGARGTAGSLPEAATRNPRRLDRGIEPNGR